MKNSFVLSLSTLLATTCLSTAAIADPPTLTTWNINGGEQDKDILAENALEMQNDIGKASILVLQEVISSQQVAEIADRLGYTHWAISDFSPPISVTGKWFKSLEVAVLSNEPFSHVAEWDTTTDKYDPRVSDTAVTTETLSLSLTLDPVAQPSRGFLRVDLENGLSVYAVHWKSSGGASGDADLGNAAKRENNARGVSADASDMLASGRSVAIAGDYNIQPIGKHVRVGSDVLVDCLPSANNCGSGGIDGYDDSMKILSDIGNGYRLLSEDLPPTYLRGNFGPGAIDHIAVAGPIASEFATAETVSVPGSSYFGSDHSPVISGSGNTSTDLEISARSAVTRSRDQELGRLLGEIQDRLAAIEQLLQTE